MLEQRVAQAREIAEDGNKKCDSLQQLIEKMERSVQSLEERDVAMEAFTKSLEERLEEGTQANMNNLDKIYKVMHDEHKGIVPMLDDLRKGQSRTEQQHVESIGDHRAMVDELRRETHACTEHSRKFQEIHEKLEPRVFHLEQVLMKMGSADGAATPTVTPSAFPVAIPVQRFEGTAADGMARRTPQRIAATHVGAAAVPAVHARVHP